MILTKQTIQTLVDIRNPKKPAQFIKNYVDKQFKVEVARACIENFEREKWLRKILPLPEKH